MFFFYYRNKSWDKCRKKLETETRREREREFWYLLQVEKKGEILYNPTDEFSFTHWERNRKMKYRNKIHSVIFHTWNIFNWHSFLSNSFFVKIFSLNIFSLNVTFGDTWLFFLSWFITFVSHTSLSRHCINMIQSFLVSNQFLQVRIFCIYTSVAVLLTYIYHITFFGGCMALFGHAEKRNLHGLVCVPVMPKSLASKSFFFSFFLFSFFFFSVFHQSLNF